MEPRHLYIRVWRTANGWVLMPDETGTGKNSGNYYGPENSYVARSPAELSKLLGDWADKQQKAAKP